jgi:hypothetical protein
MPESAPCQHLACHDANVTIMPGTAPCHQLLLSGTHAAVDPGRAPYHQTREDTNAAADLGTATCHLQPHQAV